MAANAGAHIDSSQMLPSPFDNMQGGAASVQSIPSSMQQAAPAASLAAGAPPSATSPEVWLEWFLVLCTIGMGFPKALFVSLMNTL